MIRLLTCLVLCFLCIPLSASGIPNSAPLPVPALRELVDGATDDVSAMAQIAAYFEEHEQTLAIVFDEANSDRLRGLFAMYTVALAVPYNTVTENPETLRAYTIAEWAHCGTYVRWTLVVGEALGLTGRFIILDNGWHGVVEFLIDGEWETFDPTANIWFGQSVDRLLSAEPREWRAFYAPVDDLLSDAVYREHRENGWDVSALRAAMPTIGYGNAIQWAVLE